MKSFSQPRAALSIAVALSLLGVAHAQTPATSANPKSQGTGTSAPPTGKSASAMAATDRNFMLKAAQSDVAEIQAGKTAQEKASSDAVKKFGAQMVADHTKTSEQMKGFVQTRAVQLPTAPAPKDEQAMKKMSALSGPAFDRAYMDSQVRAHREAVALFQREAKSGKDAELKSFAATTLPALQDHLKMATDLSKTTASATRDGAAASSKKM